MEGARCFIYRLSGCRVTDHAAGADLASSFAAIYGMRVAGFAAQEVVEGWQDWMMKMNQPTIAEIIGIHLPDGSIRMAGGLD